MKYFIATLSFAFIVSATGTAWARPLKGFNEGPYLYLEGALTQVSYDKDEQTGTKAGHDFEPAIGLTFGWNIWDYFSAELEGLYSTNSSGGRREHLVSANAYGKYFLILDDLTDFKSLRIMPTFKGGLSFRIASLPGNPNSTDTAVTKFGWGPSFGAGMSFLVAKYLWFGFEVQEDLVFFSDTNQTITVGGTTTPGALIYKGGFYPQFSALVFVGVHY